VLRDIQQALVDQHKQLVSLTSALRYEPQFFVIGTLKGGTTSFYANLVQHPQVIPARGKEIHFFDGNFGKGWAWYRGHFPLRFHPKALANRRTGREVITGEATPNYLFFPYVAERLARHCPNAKLIVLLRDPVERAYSHFFMEVRRGRVPVTSDEPLYREVEFLQRHSIDRVTYQRFFYDWAGSRANVSRAMLNEFSREEYQSKAVVESDETYTSMGCLLPSLYYRQLCLWFDNFAREQFLIIDSRDYFRAPLETLANVVVPFLGLSDWKPSAYVRIKNERASYPSISPELRAELAAFYKPYNEKLYHLLGVDYGWNTGVE
jgi:hypothetical protein